MFQQDDSTDSATRLDNKIQQQDTSRFANNIQQDKTRYNKIGQQD
jgi:hypothetical protein